MANKHTKNWGALLRSGLAALAVAAMAAGGLARAESAVDKIVAAGKIRVGMSSFTPWAMRDQDGEFIGFEIDVAKAVARDLEVDLELTPTAWDGIIPALLAGKFDVIIGGMSITPARNLKVNFTNPYAHSGLDLAASKERSGGREILADFNHEDVVVAMRRGVSGVDQVRRALPRATIRQFDDEASCIREVVAGNADAWISAAPAPATAVADYPERLFLPLAQTFARSNEGFALRKGDPDSLNYFDNWILTNADFLQERHDYWFRSREWASLVGGE